MLTERAKQNKIPVLILNRNWPLHLESLFSATSRHKLSWSLQPKYEDNIPHLSISDYSIPPAVVGEFIQRTNWKMSIPRLGVKSKYSLLLTLLDRDQTHEA